MHTTRLRLAAATVSLGLVPALLSTAGAVARGNQISEEFVTRLPTSPLLGTEACWQVPFNENDTGAR
jgi:hypothetical protein